jgi:predicted acetyltransferase/diadenosine tetraphosphate (Ap4A) HIT family hydrolase
MPKLTLPSTDVHASFLAAMAEFQAEGRGAETDISMVGREIREFSPTWQSPEGFAAFVAHLLAQADPAAPRPSGWVPATTFWWVEDKEYLGRIAIRHQLTDSLREAGGHIGYDVRASARGQGHAGAMLRAALTVCGSMGIEQALLTCDVENVASRRVIERTGGVLQDEHNGLFRFWIDVEANKGPDISPYHAGLPVGRPIEPRTDFRDWNIFPYQSQSPLALRMLEPPAQPERPRQGEAGPDDCFICKKPEADAIWSDENWRLSAPAEPAGAPVVLFFEPRGHWDLSDLPAERSAELGPLFQRIERAIHAVGGIGRVHVHRWGDGAAHLHWWFMGRPAGVPQLRGMFLALWDDLLPPVEESLWHANLTTIAAAMAEGGGTAHC